MASIDDLITGVTDGSRPVVTALTAQKEIGASSITVDSLEGWEETTAVHFAIYRLDTAGKKITGSQTDWKGVISGGSTISSLQLRAGDDDVYEIGCIVECMPTAAWGDDLAAGILVSHEPDGTLKDGIVSTDALATSAVTSSKITTGAVTDDKWRNNISFRVHKVSDQALAMQVFTKVTALTGVEWDLGNHFDTANSRFVAPFPMVMHFNGVVAMPNDTNRAIASLYVNGVENLRGTNGNWSSTLNRVTVSGDIKLDTGDIVELYGWRGSAGSIGADLSLLSATSFSGHLVTRTA